MEMKKEIKDKVVNTNQKYLEKFLSQDVPEKLEKQLENMDWSYIDMINDKEQKRGTFSPLEAMEISKIESNRSKYTDIGIDAIKNTKVGAILLAGDRAHVLDSTRQRECLISDRQKSFIYLNSL